MLAFLFRRDCTAAVRKASVLVQIYDFASLGSFPFCSTGDL